MTLVLLVSLPSLASAANEVCFAEPDAKALLTEFKSCQETVTRQKSIISLLKDEVSVDEQLSINLAERLSLMEEQQTDCQARADGYKLEWQKTNEALAKCETSKPDRWTWFSMGAGSGLGIALLLLLL